MGSVALVAGTTRVGSFTSVGAFGIAEIGLYRSSAAMDSKRTSPAGAGDEIRHVPLEKKRLRSSRAKVFLWFRAVVHRHGVATRRVQQTAPQPG